MYGWGMDAKAVIMFDAHSRSGPTGIGWTIVERIWRRLTIRKIGNGHSGQYFRKKKTKGRQASKNESQLETTTATELANAFSSGIRNSCGSLIPRARNFFSPRLVRLRPAGIWDIFWSSKKRGRTGFDS